MKQQFFCPICKVEVKRNEASFPFCCERCRTIDLGRWADGSYSIADTESKPEDNESPSIH